VAGQQSQETVGKIIEIVKSLTQIRIALADHAGSCVVLNALNGGFGGQTCRDCFFHAIDPATIVRKHLVRLEHLAVFTGTCHVAASEHTLDCCPQFIDGSVKTVLLFIRILGHELADNDAGLVQNHMPDGNAFRQRYAVDPLDSGLLVVGTCTELA